jgi:DNA-binding LacI/PurR family transcriptional regulator
MSLREIAKRAGVSVATASRTINGAPNVAPSLARRVREVIEQVGYYPNSHARALVSGRSRSFGLVVLETISPFFPNLVQTFEDLGIEHNYEIWATSIARNPQRLELAARRMIERRVDGVAILTFQNESALIEVFGSRSVPIVAVDLDSPGPLIKTVHIDYKHGVRQAVQHLAALGHVQIAFIGGPAHLKTSMMRKLAFQECMKEIDLKISPKLLVEGDHTIEGGVKALAALARLQNRPSAVICSNDMTAIGAMRQAFVLGLDIPRDLSIVGFDDILLAQFMTPPLTTVQVPQNEIAKMAFRALRDLVEFQEKCSREVYSIKTNLVLRRTTALTRDRLNKNSLGHTRKPAVGVGPRAGP